MAAVAFVYAPYHLFDIYVRAALGESLALARRNAAEAGVSDRVEGYEHHPRISFEVAV